MGTEEEAAWRGAITRTLSIPNCRHMNIFNWSDIRENHFAVAAVKEVLKHGIAR